MPSPFSTTDKTGNDELVVEDYEGSPLFMMFSIRVDFSWIRMLL